MKPSTTAIYMALIIANIAGYNAHIHTTSDQGSTALHFSVKLFTTMALAIINTRTSGAHPLHTADQGSHASHIPVKPHHNLPTMMENLQLTIKYGAVTKYSGRFVASAKPLITLIQIGDEETTKTGQRIRKKVQEFKAKIQN